MFSLLTDVTWLLPCQSAAICKRQVGYVGLDFYFILILCMLFRKFYSSTILCFSFLYFALCAVWPDCYILDLRLSPCSVVFNIDLSEFFDRVRYSDFQFGILLVELGILPSVRYSGFPSWATVECLVIVITYFLYI